MSNSKQQNNKNTLSGSGRSTFISENFESLVQQLPELNNEYNVHFDVVIVGSGYGGSIAAAELAGSIIFDQENNTKRPIRVCVLERGSEYLPGKFPSKFSELPRKVRFSTPGSNEPMGTREGLFDFRLGGDVTTLVANGLGGGSLINAGVMAQPKKEVFDRNWPKNIKTDSELNTYYDDARELLGASINGKDNTIEDHAQHKTEALKKFISLKNLSTTKGTKHPLSFKPAPITVAMKDGKNSTGVELNACKLCGDCATGCNHNAKNSLDCNLLVNAKRKGVKIYTGASVYKIEQGDGKSAWKLKASYSNKQLALRHGAEIEITAHKVILAAGTMGSTELLLRSQTEQFKFSPKLGKRFSSNGDMIAVTYDQNIAANAVADETVSPEKRKVGPTITGMASGKSISSTHDILIEEMAIPGPLKTFFQESVTTLNSLNALSTVDKQTHFSGKLKSDPLSVDPVKIYNTSVYAIMGNDNANGAITINDNTCEYSAEGSAVIHWPKLKDDELFSEQIDSLSQLAQQSGVGGTAIPNGLWRPLPKTMDFLIDDKRGPLFTVHPLGGCAMADNYHQGVVNDLGEVFNPNAEDENNNATYNGLLVLDGSIIASSLDTNPALTISALSLRAIRKLKKHKWALTQENTPDSSELFSQRPIYKKVSHQPPKTPTRVRIEERLSGVIHLDGQNNNSPLVVELTLRFEDKPILDMTRPFKLEVDSQNENGKPVSKIRIYKQSAFEKLPSKYHHHEKYEKELDEHALFIAPLSGWLSVFNRAGSTKWTRIRRGSCAWIRNRGLRDSYQALEERWANRHNDIKPNAKENMYKFLTNRLSNMLKLSSHAGEVRLFDYQLSIGQASKATDCTTKYADKNVSGLKTFTYHRRANPWRQLSEIKLTSFANEQLSKEESPILSLDTNYLTRISLPLMKLTSQENHANALADMASFFAYFLRILITVHTWTFRTPDKTLNTKPDRFPGKMPGMVDPIITELLCGKTDDNRAVNVRLTHYPRHDSDQVPIVMIHGYSVSGNTFLHPKVDPNLASYFWEQKKRDVWIVDLRTSSAMPTATLPWKFEDVAFADIPIAFDHIYTHCGYQKIDVLAHCMGAAMFSMAILGTKSATAPEQELLLPGLDEKRKQLYTRINKVAFSQVGPTPVFSPANIFRGYITQYASQLIENTPYSFETSKNPELAEQLYDRLLYSLPYPEEEFDIENPCKPWAKRRFVGIRHRMDVLYGRDFNVKNIEPTLYDSFNDLFGPLNLSTVNQVSHFARYALITNRQGQNDFVHRENFIEFWKFPTLSFHGEENGLVDPITAKRMEEILGKDAGVDYSSELIPNYGHQDCLIGKDRVKKVYEKLDEFYQDTTHVEQTKKTSTDAPPSVIKQSILVEKRVTTVNSSTKLSAKLPWIGPNLYNSTRRDNSLVYRMQPDTTHNQPKLMVTISIKLENGRIVPTNGVPSKPSEWSVLGSHTAIRYPRKLWLFETIVRSELLAGTEGVVTLFISKDSDLLFTDYQLIDGDKNVNVVWNEEIIERIQFIKRQLQTTVGESNTPDDAFSATRIDEQSYLAEFDIFLKELGIAIQKKFDSGNDDLAKKCVWVKPDQPTNIGDPSTASRKLPDSTVFNFAFGSCQYPSGMIDNTLAFESYQRLADLVETQSEQSPETLILLGDQIYADASAGLFDPLDSDDRYRSPHEKFFANLHVDRVARNIPIYFTLDDHEIDNNYEPYASLSSTHNKKPLACLESHIDQQTQRANDGINAFNLYQRGIEESDATRSPNNKVQLWQIIDTFASPFFVSDTRTERNNRSVASISDATIMSQDQFKALRDFMVKHKNNGRPVFITSASAMLPRINVAISEDESNPINSIRSDAWDGYPKSLHALMGLIYENNIRNVIFLSGDMHISSITKITLDGKSRKVSFHSIHSSGFYSPYPFANSSKEELAQKDKWQFKIETEVSTKKTTETLTCETETAFYPGDGFAEMRVSKEAHGWKANVVFNRKASEQSKSFEINHDED